MNTKTDSAGVLINVIVEWLVLLTASDTSYYDRSSLETGAFGESDATDRMHKAGCSLRIGEGLWRRVGKGTPWGAHTCKLPSTQKKHG